MDFLLGHLSLSWAIFAALMILIEIMIPHFGCLFPGIAAAFAFGASFTQSLSVQLIVFTVTLLLGVLLLRPWLLKKAHLSEGVQGRGHRLIGKHGVVSVVPTHSELGRITIEGQDWAMRSEDALQAGDEVSVKTVDGIVLIVKK